MGTDRHSPNFRSFGLDLRPFGPKISHVPRFLKVVRCTNLAIMGLIVFNLSRRKTFNHIMISIHRHRDDRAWACMNDNE